MRYDLELFECQTGRWGEPHCASCRMPKLAAAVVYSPLSVHKKGAGCMSLTQGLRRSLQLQPDSPAVIFGDRRRTLGSSAIALALAAALQCLGMRPGDRVRCSR